MSLKDNFVKECGTLANTLVIKEKSALLMQFVRRFWYSQTKGAFRIGEQVVTRQDIQTYGGPAPEFNGCDVCQPAEWLSRVTQTNLYKEHACDTAARCRWLCELQGDELWTHYHQNFWFAEGNDPALPAPKIACWFPPGQAARLLHRYQNWHSDSWMINLRRQLAQAGQVTILETHERVDWQAYDVVFFQNTPGTPLIPRPPIPIIMYGHDPWGEGFQECLDHFKADILLTLNPTYWRRNFNIPDGTKVRFGALASSQFFTRSNLGEKEWDLLDIGAIGDPPLDLYMPREKLRKQILNLPARFTVKQDHRFGCFEQNQIGPLTNGKRYYLNTWSQRLGRARFVTFGPTRKDAQGFLVLKYSETMGSGAVPIFPEIEDLALLKVKPMVHYIPLSEVWENNDKLVYYLDHYEEYKHIAENAVKWHRANADRLLFDDFENVVREATGYKYPKRLVA